MYNAAWNPLLLLIGINMYYRYIEHIRKESKKSGKDLIQRWKQCFHSRPWKIMEVDKNECFEAGNTSFLSAGRFWWIQVSTQTWCVSELLTIQKDRLSNAYMQYVNHSPQGCPGDGLSNILICGKIKTYRCGGLVSHVLVSLWALH